MKFLNSLFIVLIMCTITSCVSTKAVLLAPESFQYDPVLPEEVRIFVDESELDTLEYVRIAIIEATGSSGFTSQAGMYKAIRKKAAKLGANGVLMPNIKEASSGAKVAAAIFGTGTQRRGEAIEIRVLGKKKVAP